MNTSKLTFAAVFCSLGLVAHSADTYKIDPVHSSVLFSIKHLGVTDFYGGFNEIAGTVSFDSAAPAKSSVQLTIPVESLATRNPKRDQHLKSPDFFNAKQFPILAFKSSKVEGTGSTYKVTGDFSLHGVTKPITVEFKRGNDGKGMTGEVRGGGETRFTIKRSDYGMTFMQDALGDDVNIILSLEGVKQ
jgi:polyisoprenoid-binding protein YceI